MARAVLPAPFFLHHAMPGKKDLEDETPGQREKRLACHRTYNEKYAGRMTPGQREARLEAKREAGRARYARMTPEQRRQASPCTWRSRAGTPA